MLPGLKETVGALAGEGEIEEVNDKVPVNPMLVREIVSVDELGM